MTGGMGQLSYKERQKGPGLFCLEVTNEVYKIMNGPGKVSKELRFTIMPHSPSSRGAPD